MNYFLRYVNPSHLTWNPVLSSSGMNSPREVGTRLRAVREVQGKSLRAVARAAEADPAYLSKVERGLLRPSVDLLIRLGHVLDIEDLKRLSLYWEPSGATGGRK